MGRFSGLVSLLVAVLIALIAVAPGSRVGLAQEATPEVAGGMLPPDAEVDGLDLAEWSTRSWQWFFSLPQAVNPYFDETGQSCGYGQSGPVFFLAGAERSLERSCVVPEGAYVFHAGTKRDGDAVVTSGGRVLTVGARAGSLAEARDRAYAAVAQIRWRGEHHRKDIGHRALSRS